MTRAIISLSEDDKKWLVLFGKTNKKSFAETVRMAVKLLRKQNKKKEHAEILEKAYGMWSGRNGDAVEYVRKLRSEWDR